jgi:peptidoglycan L-alanyl-D-glutamate endopeptidase CwlK
MSDVTIKLSADEAEDLLQLLKDHEELTPVADRIKANTTALQKAPEVTQKFSLGATSKARLKGVHPSLVKVVEEAIKRTPIDFTVLEGLRTKERQRQLVNKGASKTMNSYHITGHAVDIAPLVDGKVTWDWKYYHQLAPIIKQVAKELGVNITWGGDWKTFKDGPHWQIPR